MIGRMLGHYRIDSKLGEGGMGVVYRAFDTHLDRAVAIKVLRPEAVASPEHRRRFVQEAKSASALNHPGIVHIYDISTADLPDDPTDYIAMEFVPGATLDQSIGRKGLPLKDALNYGIQVAAALASAHAVGIVHRDLKPANIIVSDDGRVKLLDFGLAKLAERIDGYAADATATLTAIGSAQTEEGVIIGTLSYMSPEQAEGKPVDPRSDIFSFGAVLYEMLTGHRAFSADSPAAVMAAVLREEPVPLGERIPRDVARLVARCLRKDPDRRWQSMSDLRVALRDLSEESESQPAATAAPPVMRRRRWLVPVLLAMTCVVAASWLLWKFYASNPPPPSIRQLTSYPGREWMPSLSPDGSQVAFVWNGEKADRNAIYVKMVDETNAVRLTNDPATENWPAWSPDGKRIAFHRSRADARSIWTISPLPGGTEQKLTNWNATGRMSWSPDGMWLAAARAPAKDDLDGIYLVPADGGEPRRISKATPPANHRFPAFSPDGRQVAYASCPTTFSCDIFVQPLDTGYSPQENPRQITRQGFACAGIAWSRDGTFLIYSGSLNWDMLFSLWRVNSSGKQTPERYDLAGFMALHPSIAAAGNGLAFSRNTFEPDVWRHEDGVSEPFLRSSLSDYDAKFSPDGGRIAFSSTRSGTTEIWTSNADGSHVVQLTKGGGRARGSPSWSPDGRRIVFDSQSENGQSQIFVVDADGGRPRSVSPGASSDHVPTWSRDGKWLYFASDRTGRMEVWRLPVAGGEARQITDNGGWRSAESTDGRTLFYIKDNDSSLFARSLAGGPERQVLERVSARAFAPVEDGIYYIGPLGPDSLFPIQFYEFATGASRLVTRFAGPTMGILDPSPDRKTILFTKSATEGSDLILIENFR